MQPFLMKVLQLQTFQQFVADRLDMLNSGIGFSDEFEVEVSMCGDRWGTQSRYKDWLNHMKVFFYIFVVSLILTGRMRSNVVILQILFAFKIQ